MCGNVQSELKNGNWMFDNVSVDFITSKIVRILSAKNHTQSFLGESFNKNKQFLVISLYREAGPTHKNLKEYLTSNTSDPRFTHESRSKRNIF